MTRLRCSCLCIVHSKEFINSFRLSPSPLQETISILRSFKELVFSNALNFPRSFILLCWWFCCCFIWESMRLCMSASFSGSDFVHRLVGWLGEATVSCILRHRGVQLRLAYSWARPAILAAGKGRGGMFLFLLFLYFQSFSSISHVPLFHLLYYLLSLFSLSLGDNTKWPTRVDMWLNPNTNTQAGLNLR